MVEGSEPLDAEGVVGTAEGSPTRTMYGKNGNVYVMGSAPARAPSGGARAKAFIGVMGFRVTPPTGLL